MRSPQRSLGCGAQLHADTITVSQHCTKDKFWVFFSLWERTRAAALTGAPISASPLSGGWVRMREEGVPVLCLRSYMGFSAYF